ncbi:class I SAM-dependent methyltransferase [Opitutales bacterium]|nr:class I SAM-dependent methyltransferase [Opitutales bacterium]
MRKETMKAGNFSGLASDYSSSRPDYCKSVLNGLLGLNQKSIDAIDFADIGAGTGIWTRMVFSTGVHSAIAIEPNDDMREHGIKDSQNTSIIWQPGNAEKTGLPNESVDMLTMASSFHWTEFNVATKEFHRVLRSNGRFTALWNPRLIEVNPMLLKIEEYLDTLNPNIKRVSSGRSGITENLTDKLWKSPFFEDVVYLEGRHVIMMPPERYLGAWKSVNDLQVQLGEDKFSKFLTFVEHTIHDSDFIEATYLTRAWSARKKS